MHAFPAACRIVGVEFFRAMARAYVVSDPPSSPILLDYGAGFPDFIAGFEPAATLTYLPDVARIERAWTEAYHSLEAVPLEPAAFELIEADRLPQIRLQLHPSVRIVRSHLPALTIWRMNVDGGVPAPVDLAAGGEDVLIIRPATEVEARSMPAGGAEYLYALAEGKTATEAMRTAMRADDRFDLAANLIGLIGSGVFVGYDIAGEAPASRSGGQA
ncbi:MAG: putative DNA-binding domain-containing protein [Hyphomicrobiales bacterium]